MTRYTVVWLQSARDELAELWLSASDRDSVTQASHLIDQELSRDASSKGSELSEGLRAYYAPPLKAIFTVQEEDRIAEVLRIRRL